MTELVIQPDGWRRVQPSPSAEELRDFYAAQYFQNSHGTYAQAYTDQELEHRRLLAELLVEAIAQGRGAKAGPEDALIEVGCGEGWFLAAAHQAGFAVRGLDFSADGLARFNPGFLDHALIGDAFERLDGLIGAGAAVDAVVMEHVLEHVIDPEGLLQRLPRLLKPHGVVAITVPNDFSPLQLEARAMGAITRDFWVAPPQHLNYFNADNLVCFLERMGFAVKLAYASFPIDWFLMHPGSNYVADGAAGKPAHRARMAIDLMLARQGMDRWLQLSKALFACGAGRSLTVIASVR